MTELAFIRGVLEQAPGRACLTCSFQAEDVVVLHMLRQIDPDVPVLFLDTGYHFPELLRYRDRLVDAWGVNLVNVTSTVSRNEQEQRFGMLYRTGSGRVLPHAQSGTAAAGTRRLRGVVHRPASRAIAIARQALHCGYGHAALAARALEAQSAGPLAVERSTKLYPHPRDSVRAALRRGIYQHRLRSLHDSACRSRKRALRQMGRRQTGVRHPHVRLPMIGSESCKHCSDS